MTNSNRLVLWINKEPCQIALACKISEKFDVVGVVFESRPSKRKLSFKKIIEKVIEKIFLRKLDQAWVVMQENYKNQFSDIPSHIPTLVVENINQKEVTAFTQSRDTDLVIVSGTSLIKKHMFQLSLSKGIMNLHTGLSPYIKGGPNCTNWCFAINKPELIGNTVMWLDEGIDSGKIISTETTDFNKKPSFIQLHQQVMEHAHDLYLRCIDVVLKLDNYQGILQKEISNGTTFFTKQWTLKQKWKAIQNFKKWHPVREFSSIKTIPLPSTK